MNSTIEKLLAKFKTWLARLKAKIQSDPADTSDPVAPGVWPPACTFIKAAMVTPLFVYRDASQVKSQAAALKSSGYNAIAGLVDLQSGRDYIVGGRNATRLAKPCLDNIHAVLAAGLTPILIIRNDWAVRTKTGSIPSIGGQPATPSAFYSSDMLARERIFLDSLKDIFPYIHFQLSIEPDVIEAAAFALELARHLRAAGFKNRVLLNPAGAALTAHLAMARQLTEAGSELACSWHYTTPSPDAVWNTDGRTAINSGNAQSVLASIYSSGKEFILWSHELANSPTGIPAGYLATPAAPTPPVTPPGAPPHAGDDTFLWKPVSDSRDAPTGHSGSRGGRCAVLLPAQMKAAAITINGVNRSREYAGRTNVHRQTYFLDATGSFYGRNVKVQALGVGGVLRTWTVPDGAARWSSN